jgi:hypothetical protein
VQARGVSPHVLKTGASNRTNDQVLVIKAVAIPAIKLTIALQTQMQESV